MQSKPTFAVFPPTISRSFRRRTSPSAAAPHQASPRRFAAAGRGPACRRLRQSDHRRSNPLYALALGRPYSLPRRRPPRDRLQCRRARNPADRAGRKNHLFAGSDGGGEHWAVIASLIETYKMEGAIRKLTCATCSPGSSCVTHGSDRRATAVRLRVGGRQRLQPGAYAPLMTLARRFKVHPGSVAGCEFYSGGLQSASKRRNSGTVGRQDSRGGLESLDGR